MNLSQEDLQALWEQYGPWVVSGALKILGALIVLIIGMRIASWLGRLVRHSAEKQERIDKTLGTFFGSIVQWTVTAATIIATLQVFGVEATSFVAVLGALTLAIGLSLQGALGNIASGVMIMIFRPYKLGDFIELASVSGSVRDINLFQTVLATPDNVKIMVPNSQAIDGVIKNYSGYATRRVDLLFSIDYGDDMDDGVRVIEKLISEEARIQNFPEPFVKVTALAASSVDITVRVWVKSEDYWPVKFDLTKKGKSALDAAGISIPYPHTVMVQKQG